MEQLPDFCKLFLYTFGLQVLDCAIRGPFCLEFCFQSLDHGFGGMLIWGNGPQSVY
jgi:hypothetical protein